MPPVPFFHPPPPFPLSFASKCKKFDASCLLSLFAFGFSFRQCTFPSLRPLSHLPTVYLTVHLVRSGLGPVCSWLQTLPCPAQPERSILQFCCSRFSFCFSPFLILLHLFLLLLLFSSTSFLIAGQLQSVSHIKISFVCRANAKIIASQKGGEKTLSASIQFEQLTEFCKSLRK